MNGKGMSMENMHVILTPFTSVPATSKTDLINEKREGYGTFNRLGASNMRQICLFFLHNSYRSTWSPFHCFEMWKTLYTFLETPGHACSLSGWEKRFHKSCQTRAWVPTLRPFPNGQANAGSRLISTEFFSCVLSWRYAIVSPYLSVRSPRLCVQAKFSFSTFLNWKEGTTGDSGKSFGCYQQDHSSLHWQIHKILDSDWFSATLIYDIYCLLLHVYDLIQMEIFPKHRPLSLVTSRSHDI